MRFGHRLVRDQGGAAIVEMAFAVPVLVVMLYAFVQLAEVYRAIAGIQQALGQGARYATLCINPTSSGCGSPTTDQVYTQINNSVYGIDPDGTFSVDPVVSGTDGTGKYYDLTVHYSQPTTLLMFPGPTMSVSRSKRVWIAA